LYSVRQQGGDFIVRLNWQNVPLQDNDGLQVDLLALLRSLPEVRAKSFDLQISPDPRAHIPALPVRLAAIRNSEAAAGENRKRILQQSSKKGKTPAPRTLEAAGYIFVVTSLADAQASAEQVLDLYRFHWQAETYASHCTSFARWRSSWRTCFLVSSFIPGRLTSTSEPGCS
jgi:hypothetical protein